MNICNNCGVELDSNMNHCPLCGLAAGEKPEKPELDSEEKSVAKSKTIWAIKNLSKDQLRKIFWEISGITLGSVIIVTLLINLIVSNNIDWAKYIIVASAGAFVNISAFTLWRKKPILKILASFVSLILMLMSFDFISKSIDWGTKLGVPIVVSFYFLLLIVLLAIRLSNQLGFNILAIIFIASGLFLICLEIFISLYFHQTIVISWSLIAAVSMIPIAAILLFVHYKLKKGIELKRFFHI